MRAEMILFYEFRIIPVARRLTTRCSAASKKHKDPSNKSELAAKLMRFCCALMEEIHLCCQAAHLK